MLLAPGSRRVWQIPPLAITLGARTNEELGQTDAHEQQHDPDNILCRNIPTHPKYPTAVGQLV